VRRLTFVYRDGRVELASAQRVDMIPPARPQAAAAPQDLVYELLDAQANVLHRLSTPDPIPTDVEVFSDDPERTIERSPTPPEQAVFTVLLPDVPDAEEVRLMRAAGPAAPARRGAGVAPGEAAEVAGGVEIGRFKLDKD
jgi:hypothetical protein